MMELRHPYLLLFLVPGLWLSLRAVYRWGIPNPKPASKFARWSANLLPPIILTLLVLAAAGPEWRRAVRGAAPVVDFAVVLDGSSSMKALDDGKESRWDAARRLLESSKARNENCGLYCLS